MEMTSSNGLKSVVSCCVFDDNIMVNMTDEEVEAYFEAKRNAIINANPLDYAEVHFWKGKRVNRI